MSSGPDFHGWTHRPKLLGGTDPIPPLGYYEIKVFADRGALDGNLSDSAIVVSTGDGKFHFFIPQQLDRAELVHAAAGVSVSGDVEVQVHNVTQAADYFTTTLTIDAGDKTSYTATTPVVVDDTLLADVGDEIRIDVDAADGTAEGLCVILHFAVR